LSPAYHRDCLQRIITTRLVIDPVDGQNDEFLADTEQVRIIFHEATVGPHDCLGSQPELRRNAEDGVP
jgi:hypothetical protein